MNVVLLSLYQRTEALYGPIERLKLKLTQLD
jgi:hypothetical protein